MIACPCACMVPACPSGRVYVRPCVSVLACASEGRTRRGRGRQADHQYGNDDDEHRKRIHIISRYKLQASPRLPNFSHSEFACSTQPKRRGPAFTESAPAKFRATDQRTVRETAQADADHQRENRMQFRRARMLELLDVKPNIGGRRALAVGGELLG